MTRSAPTPIHGPAAAEASTSTSTSTSSPGSMSAMAIKPGSPSAGSSSHAAMHSSSPIRSSPLSNPPIQFTSRPEYSATPTPIPRSQRRTSLRASHTPPVPLPPHSLRQSPPLSAITAGTPPNGYSNHDGGQSMSPSPPLSRSHPLLGSYPLSLLHSRMSHAHTPHSLPPTSTTGFALHIGAIGKGKTCPPGLRCPAHEIYPFSATYYDLEDGGRKSQTPWVGTVDFEEHYRTMYTSDVLGGPSCVDGDRMAKPAPPEYPGYKVAPVGQLQILVKTPSAAVKVFLVPYDLRSLTAGGRLLARERTYVQRTTPMPSATPTTAAASSSSSTGADAVSGGGCAASPGVKEKLRYSVQVQFICLPRRQANTSARESSTTRRVRQRDTSACSSSEVTYDPSKRSRTGEVHDTGMDYYLSRQIKVIFTSTPPERDDVLRTERADEVVLPSDDMNATIRSGRTPTSSPVFSFSQINPASPISPRADWDVVRRKWLARREVEAAAAANAMDDLLETVPMDQLRPATPPVSLLSSQVLSPRKDKQKLQSSASSRSTSPLPVLSPVPRSSAKATSSMGMINGANGRISPTPQPPSIKTPPPHRYPPRQRLRRGSGSLDERELSEKLRTIRVQEGLE